MNREELIITMRKRFDKIALDRECRDKIALIIQEKFDMGIDYTMDLISDRLSLYQIEDNELFYLATGLEKETSYFKVSDYFNEKEIELYSNSKYEIPGINYPIVINCVEVHKDKQWIGAIDSNLFMELRKVNKIRYNKDKQRTRKTIIKGSDIIFKTDINEKSIQQIATLMEKGEYIPDDITLDIPDDSEDNFYYDEERNALIINSIDHFDITDGYHRYLAMCKCKDRNPDFNYPMEIRITHFSLQRSQQFIYQKDQKNKMKVTNSNSMDTNRASNDVVNRLNERGNGFALAGQIQRGGGTVDFAALSDIIEYYWFKGNKKIYNNKEVADVYQEVKQILNEFIEENPEYYETYLNFRKLLVIFYLIKSKKLSIKKTSSKLKELEKTGKIKEIKLRTLRKTTFDQIESVL